jgi:hypothetical protein
MGETTPDIKACFSRQGQSLNEGLVRTALLRLNEIYTPQLRCVSDNGKEIDSFASFISYLSKNEARAVKVRGLDCFNYFKINPDEPGVLVDFSDYSSILIEYCSNAKKEPANCYYHGITGGCRHENRTHERVEDWTSDSTQDYTIHIQRDPCTGENNCPEFRNKFCFRPLEEVYARLFDDPQMMTEMRFA